MHVFVVSLTMWDLLCVFVLLDSYLYSFFIASQLLCPPLIGGGIKRCFRLTSDVYLSDVWRLSVWRLSVAYIGNNSRTERPRKTKIGKEVAHVTRDSDTTFKIKRSKVKVTRPLYSQPCWRVRQLERWAWECVGREKLLLRCRLLGRARRFGAHGGGEGRGISWRPPAYSLLICDLCPSVCLFNTDKLFFHLILPSF